MGSPFIGEIRLAAFNFAPQGWALCAGQLMSIADNPALFQLLGTTYGGDGQNTFGLPDLQGRVPIHLGNGFVQGQRAGTESVTLQSGQIPIHNHSSTQCSSKGGNSGIPTANSIWAVSSKGQLYNNVAPSVNMAANALGNTGGNQPHENRQPSLAINYIISLFGIFPSQN
jgi:microcystin-dependent protein